MLNLAPFGVYAVVMLGVFLHWAKRRFRAQTKTSLYTYMVQNLDATMMTITAASASAASLVSTADLTSPQTYITALLAGYVADSSLNKCKADNDDDK